jgi:gas vesicle protein
MPRTHNREETEWLGGETLVRPHPNEPRVSLLRGVIAGGIVLLAGVGFGRLMRSDVGKQVRESPRQLDRTNHAKTRASQECVNAASAIAIGTALGVGMVVGAVTTFLAATEAGDSIRTRLKRPIGRVSDELDRPVEAGRRH